MCDKTDRQMTLTKQNTPASFPPSPNIFGGRHLNLQVLSADNIAISLEPDQNVGPDLDPNCLIL